VSSHDHSWFTAWVAAAYGPEGFWTGSRPGTHFRTASAGGPELAEALVTLLEARRDISRVVEVGAGDGRLLAALHDRRPSLRLAGTDLRPRPAGLPPAVAWAEDLWDVVSDRWRTGAAGRLLTEGGGPVLVLAVEWLDDLPCRLATRVRGECRELDAELSPAAPLAHEDDVWADTWWPDGARLEVGTTRDRAWAALVGLLAPVGGQALMVDYGHERPHRPVEGSLAAFRAGWSVPATPTGDRNLTASVAVDAVQAAGEQAGARTVLRCRQTEALADLLPPPTPSENLLGELAARSRRAALASPNGWGGHWWLLQEVRGPL
jgi:hypothetical protein